jgi:hypothetical protein
VKSLKTLAIAIGRLFCFSVTKMPPLHFNLKKLMENEKRRTGIFSTTNINYLSIFEIILFIQINNTY